MVDGNVTAGRVCRCRRDETGRTGEGKGQRAGDSSSGEEVGREKITPLVGNCSSLWKAMRKGGQGNGRGKTWTPNRFGSYKI